MKYIEFKSKNYDEKLFKKENKPNIWILLLIGLFIGFVNGFWGGGGGMICVPTLTMILHLEEKMAHATTILIMLPLSIASFVVYLIGGSLDFKIASIVTAGFVAGGVIGAIILNKINNVVLQIVFALIIILGGIKLLFWLFGLLLQEYLVE